jgi:hypothetical protein
VEGFLLRGSSKYTSHCLVYKRLVVCLTRST